MDRGGNGWEPYSLPSLAGSAGYKKGQGIGTALVREALRVFAGRGEVPVFLHTQPWSYEAVGLYLKAGFFLCRSETFGTHKNQFQEGIRILEQYLEVDPRLCR